MPYSSANINLESTMNLLFESFGALSSRTRTTSMDRLHGRRKALVCAYEYHKLRGIRPNSFAKNEIFCRFPDEIRSVPPADLKPATQGCLPNTQPNNLYVVSSFGLYAGLLRQREFSPHGFEGSRTVYYGCGCNKPNCSRL